MVYRCLGKTGIKVSIIGIGMEHLTDKTKEQIIPVIHESVANGINYFDLIVSNPEVKEIIGKGFQGNRGQLVLAGHLGISERDGQYYKTRDIKECRELIHDLLKRLGTDYLDILHLHNVDEENDYERITGPGGILELARQFKEEGKTRWIGFSGHKVSIATKAVKSGFIDVLMHPINIVWDAEPGRKELFYNCLVHEVGLVGMKTFAGGEIFQQHQSITPVQCINYSLSQPGVATVAVGVKNVNELKEALRFVEATENEKDFNEIIGDFQPDLDGKCVYCNHCLPCPSLIDIGATIKLYQTAQIELTPSLWDEYRNLPVKPDACIECGECLRRCPFVVDVIAKMKQTGRLFTKDE